MSDIVQYNSDYFNLIKTLTAISPGIIFNRDAEAKKIIINRTNKSRSIYFKVEAPEEYFSFEGDKVAFTRFAEFHQLMEAFGTSTLKQKDNKMVIETPIGKIYYLLSNPISLAKAPSKITVPDPDITFNLSIAALGELKKINALLLAKLAKISIVEKGITIKITNSERDNSFEKPFTPETCAEDIKDFEFPIWSEIFSKIPANMNYKVSIYQRGYAFFSF